jgi:phosphoesterase RecJ-like protein
LTKTVASQIKELLSSSKRNVVITTHTNPDGDALGSSLAFGQFLTITGHRVDIIIPNDFPSFLSWMPGSENILIYKRLPEKCRHIITQAELIFCLDFNALIRLDKLEDPVRKRFVPKILIDHHPQPENEFDIVISSVETSSTAELVYKLIDELGGKDLISKSVAENIYVGIVTDTGSFSYSCNYENTYLIIADLMKRGVDGEHIHTLVYDTYSEDRMRLLGYCLSKKLKVLKEYHSAYICLTKEELRSFNYKIGDSEGIVNYALSITGVCFACLIMERDKYIRMSFRSRGNFSVNDFARRHFEGGGHKNAAGANSYVTIEETILKLEELLAVYKEQLNIANQMSGYNYHE